MDFSSIVNGFQAISSVVSLAVAVSIGIFIFQQVKERKNKKQEINERLRRTINSFMTEVKAMSAMLKEEYDPENTIPYTGRLSDTFIITNSYDGSVSSGLITYLERSTQDRLSELYSHAHSHNELIRDLAQLFLDKSSSSDFTDEDVQKLTSSKGWGMYATTLAQNEKEMGEMIPDVEDLLDKELNRIRD